MNILEQYENHFLSTYKNNPHGKYISLFILRRIESEAIFRTEGSGEPLNKEFVFAGLQPAPSEGPIQRIVISKRKQTAVERRMGRELLRGFGLFFKTKDGECSLNANNPCERCMDCMIYGYAAGGGGAQRSRVITDDAFSLHPAHIITDTRTFNAPFENTTPWNPLSEGNEKGKRMTGLGEDEYVRPESVFLDVETLHDVTQTEFLYIVGNLLRSSRYGAISSRIGKVRNTIAAVAFSDCELFSNLELTQAVYDILRGEKPELDYPLPDRNVVAAIREAAQLLRKRVVGRVSFLDADSIAGLIEEIGALYADEARLQAMLRGTTEGYRPGASQ